MGQATPTITPKNVIRAFTKIDQKLPGHFLKTHVIGQMCGLAAQSAADLVTIIENCLHSRRSDGTDECEDILTRGRVLIRIAISDNCAAR